MNKMISKYLVVLLFILSASYASAQTQAIKPLVIKTLKGRVLGQSLEELEGVNIMNKRDSAKTVSGKRGFFNVNAAKGDTIILTYSKYGKVVHIIKRVKDNVNVIMISAKINSLSNNYSKADSVNAVKADQKTMEILEKGAERDGLWNY